MIDTTDPFLPWLSGFIDGEGSFNIIPQTNNPSFDLRLTIKLRDDDLEILQECQQRFGGRITFHNPLNSHPQATWSVSKLSECLALIEVLDAFPLRAKKRHDFALWKQAVLLRQGVQRGQNRTQEQLDANKAIYTKMLELRHALKTGREYKYPK